MLGLVLGSVANIQDFISSLQLSGEMDIKQEYAKVCVYVYHMCDTHTRIIHIA